MNSTKRFSNRVEDYEKYRPSYPPKAVECIFDVLNRQDPVIADIGAGTGLLTKALISQSHRIFAVEPNPEMRHSADQLLNRYNNYVSIAGSAEETGIADASIDAITVAQAFHWFDKTACKREFQRILKDNGLVFLLWNRRKDVSPFMIEYEKVLKDFCPDYLKVNHKNLSPGDFDAFYSSPYSKVEFDHYQKLDLQSFFGRVFSSSYTPPMDVPSYIPFKEALSKLFTKYAKDEHICFEYQSEVYHGSLK